MNKNINRRPTEKKTEKKREKTQTSIVPSFFKEQRTQIIIGITVILIAFYVLFSLIGFFFTGGIDQSLIDRGVHTIVLNPDIVASNPAGKIGAWISNLLINRWFGVSSFVFCFIIAITGIRIAGGRINGYILKLVLSIAIILWISMFLGFITETLVELFGVGTGYLFLGGGHGYFASLWLDSLIGRVGTFLFLLLSFMTILFFGFEKAFHKCMDAFKAMMQKRKAKTIDNIQTDNHTEEEEVLPGEEPKRPDFAHTPQYIDEFEFKEELDDLRDDDENNSKLLNDEVTFTVSDKNQEETVDRNLVPMEDYDPTIDLSHYQYPTLDLLEEHSSGNRKVTQQELEENKTKIVETLRNYKIEIIKIEATIGPTVTLYEIIPAPGVKISRIKNLEDDIALSLSALGIRIIAPIPGAGTIGIEVPNQNPEVVSMRSIIASKKFQESKYALPVALGRTISNETYTFDLTKMPHLLVAGATGQGKSVGLNAIITSLLYKKHPSQLKFVMVDPKKVELSIYSVIERHFLAKLPDEEEAIITETTKVVNTLNSLCMEMDSRYDLLKVAQVRNIKEYNDKFVKRHLNPEKGHKYLPYIVVIVDEFADLIMTAGKEVEQPIARIAQLARAVGIHMIIATQRPSTNIITGVIKANFPARIAFKVASMIDSRTILDSPGANQLIGRGDMLISVGSEMVRVQCAFVDTPEVDAVTSHICSQQSYPAAFALPKYVPENDGALGSVSEADLGVKDPLFDEVARLIVATQQGSTSSIQRRFAIGYNRAGRIMDQLEAVGIVGPYEGSKTRQVLIPDEYSLEILLRKNNF